MPLLDVVLGVLFYPGYPLRDIPMCGEEGGWILGAVVMAVLQALVNGF